MVDDATKFAQELEESQARNRRRWLVDILARSFMYQGFGSNEAWRHADVLIEDMFNASDAVAGGDPA